MPHGKVAFAFFFSIDHVLMKISLTSVHLIVASHKFCVRFCVYSVCGNRMNSTPLACNDEMSASISSIKRVVNRYMNCLIYVRIYQSNSINHWTVCREIFTGADTAHPCQD